MNRYLETGDAPKVGKDAGIHESVPQRALTIRFAESLKESWRIAAVLALIVLVVGVPMAFVKGKKFYGSTAVVHVNPRFLRNLTEDVEQEFQSNTQYRQYVQQQVSTLGRLDVAYEALERLGDNEPLASPSLRPTMPEHPDFIDRMASRVRSLLRLQDEHSDRYLWRYRGETPTHAAWRLLMSIQAVPVPDTYLINVSIESDHPQHLARVLNAYVEVFLERSRNEEFYGMDQRLDSLTRRQKTLEAQIARALQRRSELAQELGVTTFSEENLNPFDALIIDGTRALDEARRKRLQEDSTVDVYIDRGTGALNALAEDQVSKDYTLNALRANLGRRRVDIMQQISGLEPSHPLRLAGELELREIEREMTGQSRAVLNQQKRIMRERYIAEADQARHFEGSMVKELDTMRSRASWYSQRYQEALKLQGEVERARAELTRIDERMGSMKLESEAPGFVHWSSRAVQDNQPISGGRTKWLLIVLMLGAGVFLAVPLLISALDRRISDPRTLNKILGCAPMGWLPLPSDPRLASYSEDQLLRIAFRLRKDHEQHGSRSFAFMSAKAHAGVTPLVFDLARVLQQQMSLRVAVVELDALTRASRYASPDAHDVNALLDAVLAGQSPAPVTGSPQLWTLSLPRATKRVPNLGALGPALELIAREVDIILIDSPPLLLSADSELIAAGVDCALLVARAGHCLSNDIQRAGNLLERANPPAVGVVMIDVKVDGIAGYLVDDAREKLGLPPAQGPLAHVKAVLEDPMLLPVIVDAWWFARRERWLARLRWLLPARWRKSREEDQA